MRGGGDLRRSPARAAPSAPSCSRSPPHKLCIPQRTHIRALLVARAGAARRAARQQGTRTEGSCAVAVWTPGVPRSLCLPPAKLHPVSHTSRMTPAFCAGAAHMHTHRYTYAHAHARTRTRAHAHTHTCAGTSTSAQSHAHTAPTPDHDAPPSTHHPNARPPSFHSTSTAPQRET